MGVVLDNTYSTTRGRKSTSTLLYSLSLLISIISRYVSLLSAARPRKVSSLTTEGESKIRCGNAGCSQPFLKCSGSLSQQSTQTQLFFTKQIQLRLNRLFCMFWCHSDTQCRVDDYCFPAYKRQKVVLLYCGIRCNYFIIFLFNPLLDNISWSWFNLKDPGSTWVLVSAVFADVVFLYVEILQQWTDLSDIKLCYREHADKQLYFYIVCHN